jgi:hypothetical protein
LRLFFFFLFYFEKKKKKKKKNFIYEKTINSAPFSAIFSREFVFNGYFSPYNTQKSHFTALFYPFSPGFKQAAMELRIPTLLPEWLFSAEKDGKMPNFDDFKLRPLERKVRFSAMFFVRFCGILREF